MIEREAAAKLSSPSPNPLRVRHGCEVALEGIERLSLNLLNLYTPEANSSGLDRSVRFADPKLHHMQALRAQTRSLAEINKLTDVESSILEVVLRGHDLGRHLEMFVKAGKRDSSTWHATKSVELLTGNITNIDELDHLSSRGKTMLVGFQENVLSGLPDGVVSHIKFAVGNHSALSVPKENDGRSESLGHKLCYILRDIDKLEILRRGVVDLKNPRDHDYFDPEGLIKQALLWHVGVIERSLEKELGRHYMLSMLGSVDSPGEIKVALEHWVSRHTDFAHSIVGSQILSPTDVHNHGSTVEERALKNALLSLLNTHVPLETITQTLSGNGLSMAAREHSWGSFMLLHCAMLYDLRSTSGLQAVVDEKLLADRFEFLSHRMSPQSFKKIVECFESFVGQKLGRKCNLTSL